MALAMPAAMAWADEPAKTSDSEAVRFFETKVRPVLVARCYECHGPASKHEGNLRLDSRDALLKGGDSGPAVKPGDPKGSLLVEAINHGNVVQMPPKSKLPAEEIANLTAWVAGGAPWPDSPAADTPTPEAGPTSAIRASDREFWAFQPPTDPPLPAVNDTAWPSSPIDRFVLAALEARGLRPAREADRRTLIRRATFDLHGLPPTEAEVEAFAADESSDAWARLVDRLLASPRYGERWGRHWLDIARYADSNGMDENMAMSHAWRYRDYVIAAFNGDMPYDQFLREQMAGDLLGPADEATTFDRLTATAFLVLGPKMLAEDDPVKMEMDIIDEQVDTIGRAFMGLTLGCARCHDHKFDPISMADYYALAGIFKSTKTMENYKVVAMWSERPLASERQVAALREHEAWIAKASAEIKALEDAAHDKVAAARQDSGGERPAKSPEADFPAETKAALAALKDQREALEKTKPELPMALAVAERPATNLRIHLRGNHLTLGAEVPRQFPRILAGDDQPPIGDQSSGRLELAKWLTSPSHPLTSRVMVNRIWHWHFGEGLVRSPDNFGRLGERPDNQPLLDWLARRFVDSGWSIKAMHRLIMLSSDLPDEHGLRRTAAEADPENRLLWRMNRRRLEAEEIRDAILAVSGQLDPAMGGTLLDGQESHVRHQHGLGQQRQLRRQPPLGLSAGHPQRGLRRVPGVRLRRPEHDERQAPGDHRGPAGAVHDEQQARDATRRGPWPSSCSSLEGTDDAGRVAAIYRRAYSRPPSEPETARALRFVADYAERLAGDGAAEARVRAWQAFCRVIFSSNEFVYVE